MQLTRVGRSAEIAMVQVLRATERSETGAVANRVWPRAVVIGSLALSKPLNRAALLCALAKTSKTKTNINEKPREHIKNEETQIQRYVSDS